MAELYSQPEPMRQAHTRAVYQFKAVHVIYYIAAVLEVLLVFRFVFHLFGANPEAGFVVFIETLSAIFMAPFTLIFPSSAAGTTGYFEWPVLVAMVVYALVAYGLVELINVLVARSPKEEIK